MNLTHSLVGMAKRTGISGKPTIRDDRTQHIMDAVEEGIRRAGSGAALARAVGVSQPTVSAWRSGTSMPELPSREALAKFLGWREVDILEGIDATSEGGVRALETALDYHGQLHWPSADVAKARKEAERGVRRTAREWADRLDELRENKP